MVGGWVDEAITGTSYKIVFQNDDRSIFSQIRQWICQQHHRDTLDSLEGGETFIQLRTETPSIYGPREY